MANIDKFVFIDMQFLQTLYYPFYILELPYFENGDVFLKVGTVKINQDYYLRGNTNAEV